MTLGERIKKLRKEKDLTQQQFCNLIGFKQNSISLVESGKRNISDQAIKSICREFNISEAWLRTGEGGTHSQTHHQFHICSGAKAKNHKGFPALEQMEQIKWQFAFIYFFLYILFIFLFEVIFYLFHLFHSPKTIDIPAFSPEQMWNR